MSSNYNNNEKYRQGMSRDSRNMGRGMGLLGAAPAMNNTSSLLGQHPYMGNGLQGQSPALLVDPHRRGMRTSHPQQSSMPMLLNRGDRVNCAANQGLLPPPGGGRGITGLASPIHMNNYDSSRERISLNRGLLTNPMANQQASVLNSRSGLLPKPMAPMVVTQYTPPKSPAELQLRLSTLKAREAQLTKQMNQAKVAADKTIEEKSKSIKDRLVTNPEMQFILEKELEQTKVIVQADVQTYTHPLAECRAKIRALEREDMAVQQDRQQVSLNTGQGLLGNAPCQAPSLVNPFRIGQDPHMVTMLPSPHIRSKPCLLGDSRGDGMANRGPIGPMGIMPTPDMGGGYMQPPILRLPHNMITNPMDRPGLLPRPYNS